MGNPPKRENEPETSADDSATRPLLKLTGEQLDRLVANLRAMEQAARDRGIDDTAGPPLSPTE